MSNHDSDLESNVNKRVKMNITMNIELKNSGSGKEYHKIVEAVTKNAMACIDAALSPTNSINIGTPTDTKEMAKLRRRLDNKNSKFKKIKGYATSSNTTSTVSSGTKKAEAASRKEVITNIETDKRVETEAMKKVRQSIELKKLKNLKRNKNDNPDATRSRCSIVPGTNKANHSKEATNTTPKEGTGKQPIETEAMKRIRLSLALKNKTKENNATPSTSCFTTSSFQRVEGTANIKSPGTSIKRKVSEVGTDKTQTGAERVKRTKVSNSGRNENHSRTVNTSDITYQQMDISDVTDDENISAYSVTGTGSTNTTRETKRATEKAGVETEAMKLIRRRLELNKNKNKYEVASSSNITSTTSPPSATKVVKGKGVKSPKAVMRSTAVDNPTEYMKIMKERIEQRKKPQRNETRNTKTAYAKTGHEIDPSPYTFEITEDESDDNSAVYTNKNSETTNTDNDKPNKRKRSTPSYTSSYLSAMSADVEQPDNTGATAVGRITRSKSSKTWERKTWTK